MSGKHHWRIATATAPGSSHLRDDLPNQDAVDCRVVQVGFGQVVIIAVADGAGSAPRSDEGSQTAVSAAVAAIADGINRQPAAAFSEPMAESLLRDAIKQAKVAVERYSRRHNVAARELASTLLVALASDSLLTAAQVGDGAVVAFNIDKGMARTLCEAHSGEFANETTFITSRSRPHEIASVGHASGYDYDALALITDGLQNLALKMPEREAFLGFWNPMLQDLAHTDEPEAVPGKAARLHQRRAGAVPHQRRRDHRHRRPKPPKFAGGTAMTIRDSVGVYDQTEFADNPEARCSIVLILDVSGSMAGVKIDTVNQALVKFRNIIREDSVTALRADVAIIAFDNVAWVLQDFTNGTDFEAPALEVHGETNFSQPVNLALDLIEAANRATGTAASPITAAWPTSSPTAYRTILPPIWTGRPVAWRLRRRIAASPSSPLSSATAAASRIL